MNIIDSLNEIEKIADLMDKRRIHHLKIADIEISKLIVQEAAVKETPKKPLTPEQQAMLEEAELFNLDIPNFA